MVLMLGAWTVPVCCLSMPDVSSPIQPGSTAAAGSTQTSGHQHHHHHQAIESGKPSRTIAARESCAQNCQPTGGLVAVSVSSRQDASLQRGIPTLVVPIQPVVFSPQPFNLSASPPGFTSTFPDRAAPLRI
jgi:hypothetical protein